MRCYTIDGKNNITVQATRRDARRTGNGWFSTEEQFADLIGPDDKRLIEIYNNLPGVKPVKARFAQPQNGDAATLRGNPRSSAGVPLPGGVVEINLDGGDGFDGPEYVN